MNYNDFQNKLTSDTEFAAKFAECDSIEDLIELAAKEGYSFTKEDIKGVMPLSSDDIEEVAGGYDLKDLISSLNSLFNPSQCHLKTEGLGEEKS